MKKLRKTNTQTAAARRNSSNLVHIEARLTRKNEKLSGKAAKMQHKIAKKQRKVRMRQRAKTAPEDRLLNPGLSALLKTAAIIILVVALTRTGYSIYHLKQQEKEALALQKELKLHEKELENLVSVKDTPEYVEQQARNVLHMIKPGEILYIPDPNAQVKNQKEAQTVSGPALVTAKPSSGSTSQEESVNSILTE